MNIINTLLGIPKAFAQVGGAQEIASETESQLTALITFIIGQIPLWITAFIVIVLSFFIARIVKSTVENKMAAKGFEEEHKEVQILAARAANVTVLTIGITIGLKIAGIDLTAIIAAAAFGVGFALRDIIMNFIAGVLLLSARHYTIGDIIKIKSTIGRIVEIQTRATIIKTFDGTKVIVPNSELFKNQVTSLTSNPFRRISLICGVNYGEDLEKTSKIILDAIQKTKGVLTEPKPGVAFTEWGDSSINFKMKAWVESRSPRIKIRSKIIINVTKALEAAGIIIPYPIQTVKLSKEERKLEKQAEQLLTEEVPPEKELSELKPALVTVEKTPSPEDIAAPEWLKKASEKATTAEPEGAEVVEQPQVKAEPETTEQPEVVAEPAEQPEVSVQPEPAEQAKELIEPEISVEPQAKEVVESQQAAEAAETLLTDDQRALPRRD
jgi:small conductance mechanosensitive channel